MKVQYFRNPGISFVRVSQPHPRSEQTIIEHCFPRNTFRIQLSEEELIWLAGVIEQRAAELKTRTKTYRRVAESAKGGGEL
jgi:hypothetical protein